MQLLNVPVKRAMGIISSTVVQLEICLHKINGASHHISNAQRASLLCFENTHANIWDAVAKAEKCAKWDQNQPIGIFSCSIYSQWEQTSVWAVAAATV
jgi:hypothetical protein